MPGAATDFERVEVRDVSRHFGRRRALARVTMDLASGDLVGLFGPNGAGKSTLLGVLSTLMRPTTGEVTYGGRSARDWGEALRGRIGVLGHDLFLYADLTARENLEFFGRLYGIAHLPARVHEALAAGRLADRGDDRVGSFSRGMRQRLALERALLHRPQLLLLDEPFTGLDDASVSLLAERLTAVRATGAIVVMATHDFESAEGIVTSAWCLQDGRARALAPTGGSLRQRYRDAVREARA
jgi:heme ABC exporter ATP-binding subunit CcmA